MAGVKPLVMNCVGRCCAKVADGIATNCRGWYYFNLGSEVLSRTSSQIHGRWYLPVLLNCMFKPTAVISRANTSKRGVKKFEYPMWALNRMKFKNSHQPIPGNRSCNNSGNKQNNTTSGFNKKKTHIVVPYIQGLSESFKNVCGKHGVQVSFKGGQTIKHLLVAPKDKDFITKKQGNIQVQVWHGGL